MTTTTQPRPSARIRWWLTLIALTWLAIIGAMLAIAWPWTQHSESGLLVAIPILGAIYLVPGILITRTRSDNSLGWVLAILALLFALFGLAISPTEGADSGWRLWLYIAGAGMWAPPIFTLLATLPLLFPDGHLPSPRWRWAIIASAIGSTLVVLTFPFDPVITDPDVNPIANETIYEIGSMGAFLGLAGGVAAMVAMVRRFRRARGEDRSRMKLFVSAVVISVVLMATNGIVSANLREDAPDWIVIGFFLISASIIAAAVTTAILRHKMFDIDLAISKTIVYGTLAAAVTGLYFAIVVGIGSIDWYTGSGGEPNRVLTGALLGVAVLLLQPLRTRAQHLANRLVYGKRATPYETLSHLSEQLRETFTGTSMLDRVAEIVAAGTGATEARVWVREGDTVTSVASWPAGLPALAAKPPGGDVRALDGVTLAVPVEHAGEQLGALTITKAANDPLTPTEERLVTDLGAQAGLLVRNEGLTAQLRANLEELKASRQRLVKAQDEERRRIERNLHDGAQQMLVALKVKAGLAARITTEDAVKEMLDQISAETGEALETLRDLARGIYPPLLASDGLEVALRQQASKATIPVEVEADGIGRYAQEAEAAVYFCVLEALQNVQKYAGASGARVTLRADDGSLRFSVTDDGAGFDPATTPRGAGTTNMADRLAALGGSLDLRSAPGRGTTVTGDVPAVAAGSGDDER